MEYNLHLHRETTAISHIIGVILMIALVVAIAATIYLYMSSITTTADTTYDSFQSLMDKLRGGENPPDLPDDSGQGDPGKTGGGTGDGSGGGSAPISWYDDDWSYRMTATIDHDSFSKPLLSFPVLLTLENAAFITNAQLDGDDFLFVLFENDKTVLPYEIESYDSNTGKLVAWVLLPFLSSNDDTKLYIYYGNPNTGTQEQPSNVWDENYVMIHHFEEKSGDLLDSTSYANTAKTYGGVSNNEGLFSDSYDFDGTDDYAEVTYSSSLLGNDALTIEGWFMLSKINQYMPIVRMGSSNPSDINEDGIVDSNDFSLIQKNYFNKYKAPFPRVDINGDGVVDILDFGAYSNQYGKKNTFWFVELFENKLLVTFTGTATPQVTSTKTFTAADINVWYHFVVVYDKTTTSIYLNGELDRSVQNAGSIPKPSGSIVIGGDNYRYFSNSEIDDIRLSTCLRNSDWITNSYSNQLNSEVSLGEIESK